MTNIEAAQLVAVIVAGWPNNQLSKPSIALYEQALAPLPADLATRAVSELLVTLRFPPTVAEIYELVRGYGNTARRARIEASAEQDRRALAGGEPMGALAALASWTDEGGDA